MNQPLTPNQSRAIESLDRNLIVRAGAGTGKTTVLVERFVKIISDQRASCNEILAITFTDKAANEMKKRLVAAFQERELFEARREIENAYIGTIHAFCSRVLKEHPIEAGIDPNLQVIQEAEANLLMEKALDHLIEERFSEPGVSELLRGYTERRIRKDLKEFRAALACQNLSLESLMQHIAVDDEHAMKEKLLKALGDLAMRERQRTDAEEAIRFLGQSVELNWEWIEQLEALNKKIDLMGKTKDKAEAEIVRDAFEVYIQLQVEKIGAVYQKTFCDLLADFSKRYELLKKENACFDFSDLEQKTIQLFSGDHPAGRAVREYYRRQFKFIMVDEFQDVDRLESKLVDLLKSENNLFVVGDVKQSIYGFRGSDPEIFGQLTENARNNENSEVISLTENFRTRKETLEFINPFFHALWSESKFDYEPLVAGKKFERTIQSSVDLIKIEKDVEDSIDETRLEEARAIAIRIQELMRTENYEFKDFVLLFRSSTSMPLYEQELRNAQIPYYVIGGEGFYERSEIRDLLNVLRILENPKKDIPLAAVLRSPLFCVTDDSLFWISRHCKSVDKKNSLYQGVLEFESIAELADSEKVKIRRFWSLFQNWLQTKERMTIAELVERILEDTRYDLYVLGLAQGKRQYANLKKLIDLARDIGSREALHLGDFIRLVESFETHEARESEAQVQAEKGNVVRLMTVHKAKGLEFKCVVLPDLSRNAPNTDSAFLSSSQYGIGIKVYEPKTGDLRPSLSYVRIREESKAERIEELKRLLYVAMTRAEERLIFAGTIKKKEDNQKKKKEKKIPNWYDWISEITEKINLKTNLLSPSEPTISNRLKRTPIEFKYIRKKIEHFEALRSNPKTVSSEDCLKRLDELEVRQFDRIDLPVSAYHVFLRDAQHEEYRLVYELGAAAQPFDLKIEEPVKEDFHELISPAEFGTLLHSIFESLVYQNLSSDSKLRETVNFFTRHEDEEVRARLMTAATEFLNSKIYSEIKNSREIYTEIPFSLRLKYGIIHGTLDLLYQTQDGKWVILDYKTSQISGSEVPKKAKEYELQMELYALACCEILGIEPDRAALYFTTPNQTYDFKFQSGDFDVLRGKYEELQKGLIDFRKSLLSPNIQNNI